MNNLIGKTIRLRALEPEDLDFLYLIENNQAYWEISNTQTPFSRHILKQYLKNSHLDIYQAQQFRFIIENKEQTVGTIDLFDFNAQHSRVGVGILIHPDFQQKGYASEALNLLNNYVFYTLNIKQLYANIVIENKKSISLFKKLGYQKTGVLKNWIFSNGKFKDVAFYQLLSPTTI